MSVTKVGVPNVWFQLHKWLGITLAVLVIPIPLTGAALVWHGTGMPVVWQIVIFVSGILPALLAVTGILTWLRMRRRKRSRSAGLVEAGALAN